MALTHRSFGNEQAGESSDYESLEFLGDSILGFLISEFLYLSYPNWTEGRLSKLKSQLVSTKELATLSQELGLGDFLRLSHGEEKTGGRRKRAILADLFESLVAAIYLDGGIESARDFILEQFGAEFERIASGEFGLRDHKSALQERLHSLGLPGPAYSVTGEEGPDHRKLFRVAVLSESELLGAGEGRSKKEAEQMAARRALRHLDSGPSEKEPVS
jgi:ribonuclease-3